MAELGHMEMNTSLPQLQHNFNAYLAKTLARHARSTLFMWRDVTKKTISTSYCV